MKKMLFAALAMVAVLFASCEKIEPTAVAPENLKSNAVVAGFVQYQYYTSSSTKVEELSNHYVTVLQKVGDNYITFSTKTNSDGYYKLSIPAAAGTSIKVKVQASCTGDTYYQNQDGKGVTGEAIFCAESAETPVSVGQTVNINLLLKPVSFVEQPSK